ncbi:MAG: discoidin domain-containing protein [Anaerolineales bacterium]|jgi:hypothetical protein
MPCAPQWGSSAQFVISKSRRFVLTFVLHLMLLTLTACGLSPEPRNIDGTPTAFATQTEQPQPTEAQTVRTHRIGVRSVGGRAEFYDTIAGNTFLPRGANYFYIVPTTEGFQDRFFGLDDFNPARVQADFGRLHEYGYNTVRIFIDSCGGRQGCISDPSGIGLNPLYLDNIVETMRIAGETGLHLLLTSNDLPSGAQYWSISDQGINEQFGGYRNAHYLTSEGIEAGVAYWNDLMNGLAARGAPFENIFAWSLLNEQWYLNDEPPFSLTSGYVTTANGETYDMSNPDSRRAMAVEGMLYYIDQLRAVIKRHDPKALVTMGFFVPDYPNPIRQGEFRYVETAPLLQQANLDFFDFHAYPGNDSLASIAENFGLLQTHTKPVLMGEVGAFIDRYDDIESAVSGVHAWIAQSCQFGFDGWLYWGVLRAPEAIGDSTWSLFDANGRLLEALAPSLVPDPCAPEFLPPENLSLGKPVRASNSLPDQPPENAVDGSAAQWGAGFDAPQWIEIDLGRPRTIGKIQLTVAQWPAGETVHQIWGGATGEALKLLHEFRGSTEEGDMLVFEPVPPIENLQILRFVTTSSPSWVAWRELEVFAP